MVALANRSQERASFARVVNTQKRLAGDFVLGKFPKEGEPSWEAPLGAGRPGWHMEDTAITERHWGWVTPSLGAPQTSSFPP